MISWSRISDKPDSFPPSYHDHNDKYYMKSEIDTKLSRYYTDGEVRSLIGDLFFIQEFDSNTFYLYEGETSSKEFVITKNGYEPLGVVDWCTYNDNSEGQEGYGCSFANVYAVYISDDRKRCVFKLRAESNCYINAWVRVLYRKIV